MFGGVYVECSLSWGFVGDRTLLLGGYSLGYGLCIDRVFRWWFVELLCLLVCWCMCECGRGVFGGVYVECSLSVR